MLNVFSPGKDPYLKALPIKSRSFYENIILVILVLIDLVKVLILTLFEIIKIPVNVCLEEPAIIKGQNALITGGANGIGKAIALELAKCGCNIIIADIDEQSLEKTLALLRKFDVKSMAYSIDVANPEEVTNLKHVITESLGQVDILVNNAGLIPLISLREGSPSDIERIVDVNINANIWTIRTFLPDMIQKKSGHIVQMSSMSALHPLPRATLYTATKFAVTGLMTALEEELRQEGMGKFIHFTTVHPYFVSTRLDLMNTLDLRFPAISAEKTASETVKAILFRKRRVVIPHFDDFFTLILRCLPYTLQCHVRDYILRESETRVIK